jgi:uncharacterized membrane protein
MPWKAEFVFGSAVVRLLSSVGVCFSVTRFASSITILVLMLSVLPVNLRVAITGQPIPGLVNARWYPWARLVLHAGWIIWSLWSCYLSASTTGVTLSAPPF